MPSTALAWWRTVAALALDEVEAAHASIGGTGRGRRYATGQVNNAYAVLLSSQFQRFCRDLHTAAVNHVVGTTPPAVQDLFRKRMTDGRKLDTGNPNPGNIGSDFNRLGFDFWPVPALAAPANLRRRRGLEQLNEWRNAIAHHDFSRPACGGRETVGLAQVRRWRRACGGLATAFDAVTRDEMSALTGTSPW